MKKRSAKTFIILLGLFIALFSIISVQMADAASSKKVKQKSSHAEKVDKKIERMEEEIQESAESYKDGDFWGFQDEDKKKGKKNVGKYLLRAPTYITRAITWPLAIFGDFLIKKGVVRDIVEVISNDDRTFWVYPKLELGFGSGFGGGIGVKHTDLLGENYQFSADYLIHINMNQKVGVSLGKPDAFYIKDKPVGYELSTKYIHTNNASYYGLGIDSSINNHSHYKIDGMEIGGWFGYEFWKNLLGDIHLYVQADATEPKTYNGRSIDAVFPPSQLIGLNDSQYFFDIGLRFTHDDTSDEAVPEKGGFRRISFDRFQGPNTTKNDYNQYELELIQYIKLWADRHVLLLRTDWIYKQVFGGNKIPFYRLARLDVHSPLRSYDVGRFQDRGRAVFNIEYYYPVWSFIDGVFFFDTGRTFHDFSDLSINKFKVSGGGGITLRSIEFFLFKFQIAYGGEGVNFLMKASKSF